MTAAILPILNIRNLLIGMLMLAAAGLAYIMTPRQAVAQKRAIIDLEAILPNEIGKWRLDNQLVPVQISPDVQAKLAKIYNQTLSRVYVNENGEMIMLSIAYGSDQSDSMSVHKPEVCYAAQGFQIKTIRKDKLDVGKISIPVVRLVAEKNSRTEPITYWITVGDKVVNSGLDKKFAQIRYGLSGVVPDGLLFRVSSIKTDAEAAYLLHKNFVSQLYMILDVNGRNCLFGKNSGPTDEL